MKHRRSPRPVLIFAAGVVLGTLIGFVLSSPWRVPPLVAEKRTAIRHPPLTGEHQRPLLSPADAIPQRNVISDARLNLNDNESMAHRNESVPYSEFLRSLYFPQGHLLHRRNATTTAEHAPPSLVQMNATVDEINAFLLRRAYPRNLSKGFENVLTIIPVNDGYIDFGLNLMCSLFNVSLRGAEGFKGRTSTNDINRTTNELPTPIWMNGNPLGEEGGEGGNSNINYEGFVFTSMDRNAHEALVQMGLPVFHDPDLPFVTSKSAAWADPKFHALVCTKLIPVQRALRLGLRVVLADADIVFLRNPVPYMMRTDVGLTFSIGSCHKDLPDNFHFTSDGIEKLNTGFYIAHPTKGILRMITKALEVCSGSTLTGDQPAINSVIQGDWDSGLLRRKGQSPKPQGGDSGDAAVEGYSYSFFDGCLFANGCVYFKHLCQNTTTYPRHMHEYWRAMERNEPNSAVEVMKLTPRNKDPVMVHANFLVGKKEKVKHLRKYGLWDDQCISSWRSRLG